MLNVSAPNEVNVKNIAMQKGTVINVITAPEIIKLETALTKYEMTTSSINLNYIQHYEARKSKLQLFQILYS